MVTIKIFIVRQKRFYCSDFFLQINECAGKAELSAKKGSSTAPAVPAQASKSTTSTKSSGKPVIICDLN